jgi:hypothetical protein
MNVVAAGLGAFLVKMGRGYLADEDIFRAVS